MTPNEKGKEGAVDLKDAACDLHGLLGTTHNQRAIGPKHDAGLSDRNGVGNVAASDAKAFKIVMYGAVNAMMAIPSIYGYAAIIFRFDGLRV